MAEAEVGDDVFGDDPTVNRLQEKVAKLLGKEAAIYVPSGSMANETAIRTHTEPGDEIICHVDSHTYNYEGGGPAAHHPPRGRRCDEVDWRPWPRRRPWWRP